MSYSPKKQESAGSTAIGSFDAKTHWSELLRRVSSGETITITHRGVPLARLSPIRETHAQHSPKELRKAFRTFQKAHPLKGVTTRDLIQEGRRP